MFIHHYVHYVTTYVTLETVTIIELLVPKSTEHCLKKGSEGSNMFPIPQKLVDKCRLASTRYYIQHFYKFRGSSPPSPFLYPRIGMRYATYV